MRIRRILAFFVLALVGLGFWLIWMYRQHYVADRDFDRLLAGSTDIALVSLECKKDHDVLVKDPAAMRYLSEMFRSAKVAWGNGKPEVKLDFVEFGGSYEAKVGLSSGATVKCSLNIGKKKDRLLLLFPLDSIDDGLFYLVVLREPVPQSLAGLLSEP